MDYDLNEIGTCWVTGQLFLGQLPPGQLPCGQLPRGNYPIGQLPHRTTIPLQLTHQDNYVPPSTITPRAIPLLLGQLPPRTITPIISTAPPSLTGNRREYFRVVGILEMVEKTGRCLQFAKNFKVYHASVRSFFS